MIFNELIGVLQQFGSVRKIRGESVNQIRSVDFVKNQTKFDDEVLYFSSHQLLDCQKNYPSLCIIGAENVYQHFDSLPSENLAIVEARHLQNMYNHARRILQLDSGRPVKHEEWLPIINEMTNLYDMSNTLATIFENSIVIMDINHRVLAYSNVYPINDPVWSEIIEKGHLLYEHITDAEKTDFSLAPNTGEAVTLTCWASPLRKLCSKIALEGDEDWIGYIVMLESESSISAFHLEWMPMVSRIISKILAQDPYITSMKNSLYKKTLYEMIIGATPANVSTNLQYLGLHLLKPRFVLVIEHLNTISDEQFLIHIPQRLKQQFPDSHATFYNDQIVLLLLQQEETEVLTLSQKKFLVTIASKEGLRIGISNTFESIAEFKEHYEQAKKVLTITKQINERVPVCYYKDYLFSDLLSSLEKTTTVNNFCHPALKQLKHYDEIHDTDLFQTLFSYLNHSCSLKATADALFIHRNSLIYRMERIKKVTDIDLTDSNVRFQLQVSFQIARYLSKKAQAGESDITIESNLEMKQ
ncbi:PucR family transcriptional regulator [Enterococcus pallens]|uniref:PucR C-terminal helix-turn-helix domain-containing protein n=1 Tax=Enterococcus pallens ATCC BAA-351 TaxID=1158607 RepID=R2SV15_9ENTE|nr:helix-turn-helix domain-containing protein [Enterococcus pallens]EOH91904.1 hypothetical protein UAU_03206 [Enterococcus pallens ATCC BAA-351]EOU25331.1 hypothetical protein I588_01319 [Enterococcus pallens ATCC BAA-351]